MHKTCETCGKTTVVRAFRYWDGLCEHCRAPLDAAEKRERPTPTREEVADYLAHMDALNTLAYSRRAELPVMFLISLALGATVVGIGLQLIKFYFGIGMCIVIYFAGITILKRLGRKKCPRCEATFVGRAKFRGSGGGNVINACANCGLRILMQGDLAMARKEYVSSTLDDIGIGAEDRTTETQGELGA